MKIINQIQHLYWRAGFGLSISEWKALKGQSIEQAVDDLFKKAYLKSGKIKAKNIYGQFDKADFEMSDSKEEKKSMRDEGKALIFQQNAKWVRRMADPDQSALLEKMCLFWHGHFACETKTSPRLAYEQLNTIRQHALGNFRDFVQAMAKDVSMIRYLNNQQNKKKSPNENFARELMELFTIGRGHYTEMDVKQAAKAFTGWSSNFQNEFEFKSRKHDFDQKQFMGKVGYFNGNDIIDIILDQKQTAHFITRKIYTFFVNENVDEKQVELLANSFYDSNYDIEKLMRTIFTSDWFYAPKNVGNRIKSPIELTAGIMRTLDVNFKDDFSIYVIEKALGQILFKPPNVAGWPGGKAWIDNATLMLRLNLVNILFEAVDMDFKMKEEFEAQTNSKAVKKLNATVDVKRLLKHFKDEAETQLPVSLSAFLLQAKMNLPASFFDTYTIQSNREDYIKTLVMRIMSMPEYQVC